MKITEQDWTTATALVMASTETVRLFNNVPDLFDLFALFSLAVYDRIKGEDLTSNQFIEKLVEVVEDILPDRKTTKIELVRSWMLVTFGVSVYNACKAEKSIKKRIQSIAKTGYLC